MREALGDGYVEALRRVYPDVPDSADYVMYWWDKAAELVRTGRARRFGLITTNSLRQTFNRRVLEHHRARTARTGRASLPYTSRSPSPTIRGWTAPRARRCGSR